MARILLSLVLVTACSSSDFDAGTPVVSPKQPATNNQANTNTSNPNPGVTGTLPAGNTPQPSTITPDSTELINNCSECFARAKQLSALQGFTATKAKTYNMGKYKVETSSNICDIHFMADMNLPIDDHEGRDSSGQGQVMIYCPCNCGWSNAKPVGNYFN